MRLLFDQNLSPRLVQYLADLFPDSIHVASVGLDRAFDREVWTYAAEHGYIIVTKDVDFSDISILLGFPPKVIWIRRGNCSTKDIVTLLRSNYETIKLMNDSADIGTLELF